MRRIPPAVSRRAGLATPLALWAAPAAAAEAVRPIRCYGMAVGGVLEKWQAYAAGNPGVSFVNTLPTSDAAFPALVTGVADLGPNGGDPSLSETLSFFETRGYHVSAAIVATGAYDIAGRSNGPVIFVHQDNPLDQLTVDQLDGVFGSERVGGLRGFQWTPALARGADANIRTWGQLGLTGGWADRQIQTYGHGPGGTTRFFQLHILGNSDKWNPNYRGFVETGSKAIAPEDPDQKLGLQHMLRHELGKDRFGIGWSIMSQAKGIPGLKPLALAARGTRNFVAPSRASFADRSYPLARNIYIYYDRAPGAVLEPRLAGFLKFVLSDQGQTIVAIGDYLPLPADMRRAELAKLEFRG